MENVLLTKSDEIKIEIMESNYSLVVFPFIDEIYVAYYNYIYLYSIINYEHILVNKVYNLKK